MLPGVGGTELVVIAIVALIVVGPKDLPVLMRKVGQFMNRMRGMAAEFRASFDEMARQSELDELRKEVEALRRGTLDPLRSEMETTGREIETSLYPPYEPAVSAETPSPDWAEDAPAEPALEAVEPPPPVQPKPKPRKKAAPKPPAATADAPAIAKPRARKVKA